MTYLLISSLGEVVFLAAGDWPIGVLFIGLALIFTGGFSRASASRGLHSLGFCHYLAGPWLMYPMVATGVNLSLGWHWPL